MEYDWDAHQDTVPKLPLPPLPDTLERYLSCVAPLLAPAELSARL